jgi:hypothetical protein
MCRRNGDDLDLNAEASMVKKQAAALVTVVALVAAACSNDKHSPTGYEISAPLYAKGGMADFNMNTHLSGGSEVPISATGPNPSDSKAEGQAIFRVNEDGSSVDFKLIATNIDNVIMAHIHCAPDGVNGPIRMWLYPVIGPSGTQAANGAGRHDGILASGTFDPRGVTCPAANGNPAMPLLDAIRAGLTYVNVHTNDGIAPTNTGPGDFPGGEIRGQLDREK